MTTKSMPHRQTCITIPKAVGVFDSFETLQAAIYDLRMPGFSGYDISLLGGKPKGRSR